MGTYSRFIGRIGALAVALGVGAAVATSYGLPVAHADETSDTPPGETAEPTPGGNDGGPSGGDQPNDSPVAIINGEPAGGDDNPGNGSGTGGGDVPQMNLDASTVVIEQDLEPEDHPAGGGPDTPLPTPDQNLTPAPPVDPPSPSPDPAPQAPTANPAPPSSQAPPPPAPPAPGSDNGKVLAGEPNGDDPAGGTPVIALDQDTAGGNVNRMTLTDFSAQSFSQNPSVSTLAAPNVIEPPQPDLFAGLATLPGVVLRVATTIAAAFLTPFLAPGPAAPGSPPMLWAVLAWVRREIQRTLFNQTPQAVNDSATTDEDTDVIIAVLGNDSDFDEDPLVVTDYTQPANGSVVLNANGTFTYTPNENFHGTDTFEYAVQDASGAPHYHGILQGLFNLGHQDTATVTVTVGAVNDVPVAFDDAFATDEDTPVNGTLPTGTDADNDTLTYAIATDPAHGTITNFDATTGTYTYTPDQDLGDGETRDDTFTYTVTDGAATSTPATVTITVTGTNDAPAAGDGAFTTDEDTALVDSLPPGTDVDGSDTLTYTIVDPPTNGTITAFDPATGAFTYVPDAEDLDVGETRGDSFTYTVSDGDVDSPVATITITITGVNDAPVAVDDAAETDEDSPVSGDVLDNDTDVDVEPLTVANPGTQTGTYGSIVINPDGSYTYTPGQGGQVAGASGAAITITDPSQVTQGTATGLFGSGTRNYIAIVFTPTSTQSYSFGQTTAPVDTVMAIYDGAFDPTSPSTNQVAIIDDSHDASTCGGVQGFCPRVSADLEVGQPVTIVITTFSQNVPLGLPQNLYTTGPGVFAGSVIDPNTLDEGESATDEFTYVVTDGDATDTGTVTVTINGVNDAPVAVADTASIAEDTAAGVVVNVVANDTDVDVEPLTVSGVTNGTYGTVTYSGGTVTYTLNNANPAVQALGTGESMTDTFTYTVTDGTADDDGTVTITITGVNDAPVAADDAFIVTEDGTVTFTVAGLTGNDFDAEGDPLTVGVGQPGNGTLSFSGGVYTYTPAAVTQALDTGDSATETFNYLVSDGNGGFDSASITITITGVNDAPVANPDHAGTVSEDSSTPLTYDVVANDTDVDDEPLAVSAVSNGSHGSVTFSGGSITYTLNNSDPVVQALGVGESLTDTFTYTVGDGTATAIGTVTVTVTGVNDAPVITVVDAGTPDSVTGIINGSVTATDADGDTLTYGLPVTETTYGSVSINPQTGAFVYTPDVPVPSSAIPGTDFEDGTLAGWNVGPQTGIFDPTVDNVGDGVSVTSGSLTFSSPASDDGVPARSWVYTPDGHAAAISPTEAQTFAQAGTALGLTVIQQQAIIATSAGTIQDAAWISKTVHLEADKTYTMSWNYISTDYQPYNDGSITTLVYQGSGPAPTTYVNNSEGNYAILGYTNTGTGDYSTGSYGSTGWQTSTYRVSQTGDYTLGFAVFNLRDTAYDPILLVDDQGGTTLRDGQPYAPVPPNSPTAPRTVDDTFTVTVSDGNGGSVDTDVTVQVTIIPAPQTPTV